MMRRFDRWFGKLTFCRQFLFILLALMAITPIMAYQKNYADNIDWKKDNLANDVFYIGAKPTPTPTPDPDKEQIAKLEAQVEFLNSQIEVISLENQAMATEIKNANLQRQNVIKSIAKNLGGKFTGKSEYIYNICVLNNVRPELMASIFRHETANGTIFAAKNNPGGIRIEDSYEFRSFDSLEMGIKANVMLIKREYIDKGRKDIRAIGKRYCPTDDPTDTQNLNKDWIPSVTALYKKILTDAGGIA